MSGVAPTIRAMRAADREAVIGLLWELNRHEATLQREQRLPFDRDESREAAIACYERDCERAAAQDGALVVAEREGVVVAFLCWIVETAEPFVRSELRRYGYVVDLVVAEGHRGAGIGTLLLAEAELRSREHGLPRLAIGVLAGNEVARRAYDRFGFAAHATEMMKALD
jgi:GNAT superfamily N-acetyltransferase